MKKQNEKVLNSMFGLENCSAADLKKGSEIQERFMHQDLTDYDGEDTPLNPKRYIGHDEEAEEGQRGNY